MLGLCQSTRTAKNFQDWLPACFIYDTSSHVKRAGWLLFLCHATAANQGPHLKGVWAHHHLWLVWIGTSSRLPAVRLAGVEVSGKSTPSFSWKPLLCGGMWFCVYICVYSTYSMCFCACNMYSCCTHKCVCVCACTDWHNLLFGVWKRRLPHLPWNNIEKVRSPSSPVFMGGESQQHHWWDDVNTWKKNNNKKNHISSRERKKASPWSEVGSVGQKLKALCPHRLQCVSLL